MTHAGPSVLGGVSVNIEPPPPRYAMCDTPVPDGGPSVAERLTAFNAVCTAPLKGRMFSRDTAASSVAGRSMLRGLVAESLPLSRQGHARDMAQRSLAREMGREAQDAAGAPEGWMELDWSGSVADVDREAAEPEADRDEDGFLIEQPQEPYAALWEMLRTDTRTRALGLAQQREIALAVQGSASFCSAVALTARRYVRGRRRHLEGLRSLQRPPRVKGNGRRTCQQAGVLVRGQCVRLAVGALSNSASEHLSEIDVVRCDEAGRACATAFSSFVPECKVFPCGSKAESLQKSAGKVQRVLHVYYTKATFRVSELLNEPSGPATAEEEARVRYQLAPMHTDACPVFDVDYVAMVAGKWFSRGDLLRINCTETCGDVDVRNRPMQQLSILLAPQKGTWDYARCAESMRHWLRGSPHQEVLRISHGDQGSLTRNVVLALQVATDSTRKMVMSRIHGALLAGIIRCRDGDPDHYVHRLADAHTFLTAEEIRSLVRSADAWSGAVVVASVLSDAPPTADAARGTTIAIVERGVMAVLRRRA